jgi:alpha-tubulin suppressor-like RCC1 family protein
MALVMALVAAWLSPPDAVADSNEATARPVAAASVTAGSLHTCVLLTNGRVRCWGAGSYGRLGYGEVANIGDDEPASAAGDVPVGASAQSVSAGYAHTCAVVTGGRVRCWGIGVEGRLGYGNTDNIGDDETPAAAGDVALGGTAVAVTTGTSHTCALLSSGHVRCWGSGTEGQLGYGNTVTIGDDETPATAGNVPLGELASAITAGSHHTCALLVSGDVRCWGNGTSGRLGYGSTEPIGDDETPASAGNVYLGAKAVAVTAGNNHTCALLESGDVRCWGHGLHGQLGYGNTASIGDDETPGTAMGDVPVGGNAVAITGGGEHTCVVLVSGAARCWGSGGFGQLGNGGTATVGNDEPASAGGVIAVGGTVLAVSAGGTHTCGLLTSGDLRCWGSGSGGQLGYGIPLNIGDTETPASVGVVPVGGKVRTRAPVTLTATAKPLRDRRPPFAYAVSGSITPAYPRAADICTGRIALTLRKGDRRVGVTAVTVGPTCTWSGTVAVRPRPAASIRTRTTLTLTVTYGGTTNLLPAGRTLRVSAR